MATSDIIYEFTDSDTRLDVSHPAADVNYGKFFWFTMDNLTEGNGCAVILYRSQIEDLIERLKRALHDTE